ncbi:putative odorant-binding protein A10 [Solenopsis invicta]|uniref:putative odorant-binding protein A10 n=1 Tax=Solenopsis invicta TaxID=13686 RepID=UPI000595AE0F|nr:putative odorant-binding protein A10 [Solenopsis invicta]
MARLSCIVTIIGIALMCVVAQEDLYSDKFDGIDVKSIITNNRLRNEYYDCFMGISPCVTADAKFFKDIFFDALGNKCKRCTEKQKEYMKIIQDWYTTNNPDKWQAAVAKSEDLKKKNARK